MLTDDQVRRYARQIVLDEVGGVGQQRLIDASVLVVGAGGLGSPAALYLAAAGVGRIGLCDPDAVDVSNLHRQILFSTSDVGRAKVVAGEARLRELNPDVRVEKHTVRVTADNARELCAGYDLIVDGTDDIHTKFLLNDVAVSARKYIVIGGVIRFEGQVLAVRPRETACYRCLFEEPPPRDLAATCQQAGVLGAIAGVVGSLQAVEALRLLLGVGASPREAGRSRLPGGRVLIYDALDGRVRDVEVSRREDCHACGQGS
ncbi:MAG: HesA/MoeB/ThiF family protein [Myxococcota bacterium]